MALLDVMGQFWLATKPESRVPGRLVVNEENRSVLDLNGSLYDLEHVFDFGDSPVRILGITDGKFLTLDDCLKDAIKGAFTGNIREQYSSSLMLEGSHFTEGENLEFDGMLLKLRYLEQWTWLSGVRETTDNDGIMIRISKAPKMKKIIEDGEIELGFDSHYSGEMVGLRTIEENCVFKIDFNDRKPMSRVRATASILQDLITLGVGKPSAVRNIQLLFEKETLKLYTRWRAQNMQGIPQNVAPTRMLFTLHDIGGIDGVSQWINQAKRFESVLAPLRSYWYIPDLDVETRFISIFIAAEALAKVLSENAKSRRRIKRMIQRVSEAFSPMIDDTDSWAEDVCNTRNELIHRSPSANASSRPTDLVRLFFLGESLYYLVVLCLLHSCGMPEHVLLQIRESRGFQNAASRLRE